MCELFTNGTIDEDSPTPCDKMTPEQYVAYQTFTDKFIAMAT